jgi:aerobic carbon-monoxide dehydrogenase medium subunit
LPAFEYHAAASVPEALDLLGLYGDEACLVAGGASLVLMMRQGSVKSSHVIGLRGVDELRGIWRLPDGGLEIRALTTHREAECSPEVQAYCPALTESFSRIATVRVRNQGTVGGNLAFADPAHDPPPMLLVLDARVVIAGPEGERTSPLSEFFVDSFQTVLGKEEILVAVRLPALPSTARSMYLKFLPRGEGTEGDYATVSVAATLWTGPDNICEDVRLALGSVGPVPMRVGRVENVLRGERLIPDLIEDAAGLVCGEIDPLDDVRGSARYKREMARVWTGRILQNLLERA